MKIWLIFSLIAAFCWAIGLNLIKKGLNNIPPLWNNIIANIVKFLIWVPAALFLSGFKIHSLSLKMFFLIFTVGFCYMFLYYAMAKGKLILTGTMAGMSPLITVLLASFFLKEIIRPNQWFGIFLILFGGILLALPKKIGSFVLKEMSWFWWGGLVALFAGLGDFLTKVSSNIIGAKSHLFYLSFCLQPISLINYLVDKKGRKLPKFSKKNFLPSILGVTIVWFGSFLYFLSFDYGPASLIAPVAAIYPVLTAIFAILFLKEKVAKRQVLGIVFASVGLIIISS